jgi:hypothetical protein
LIGQLVEHSLNEKWEFDHSTLLALIYMFELDETNQLRIKPSEDTNIYEETQKVVYNWITATVENNPINVSYIDIQKMLKRVCDHFNHPFVSKLVHLFESSKFQTSFTKYWEREKLRTQFGKNLQFVEVVPNLYLKE